MLVRFSDLKSCKLGYEHWKFSYFGSKKKVQFWKNGIVFERRSVYLSNNSQKLFFQTTTAQQARNLLSRCTTSDLKENCPLLEESCMATESCPLFERRHSALNGNGKLPLVWMAPQRIVISPQSNGHNRTLGYREGIDNQNHYIDTGNLEVFVDGL